MHDMDWLHIWVLNYYSVLAVPFSSVLPWVFKVEDEQCVMGFYNFYLPSMYSHSSCYRISTFLWINGLPHFTVQVVREELTPSLASIAGPMSPR